MGNKEIIEIKLENAKLKHANIQLQGMLLSRDLSHLNEVIVALEAELASEEAESHESV